MIDRTYAIIKTLENKIAIAERIEQNTLFITLDVLKEILAMLKEQESIVRCKDCEHSDYGTNEDGEKFLKCIGSGRCYGGTTPNWFCADGERRQDDV